MFWVKVFNIDYGQFVIIIVFLRFIKFLYNVNYIKLLSSTDRTKVS